MATLDDKLLGEKLHYYCSSSSEDEYDDKDDKETKKGGLPTSESIRHWDGTSSNTGPKGVIRDFQQFKQLEREQREEQKEELAKLASKFTLTCRPESEDAKENKDIEEELAQLMDDTFIQQFVHQRMQEMLQKESQRMQFGTVLSLKDGDQFLMAVDKEDQSVTVLILLYEPGSPGCSAAVKAIDRLARDHVHVKFCSVRPSLVAMSARFKESGVPALLAYKAGQLVASFVRLTDDLGFHFNDEDLEAYLVEHGIINDKSLVPEVIKVESTGQSTNCDDDED